MPQYRIHRMKSVAKDLFRWAPHTGGLALVKAKDYEAGEEIEGANPYETWQRLAREGRPLEPGDLLETLTNENESGGLLIVKYIGFEPAQWFVPEPKPAPGEIEAVPAGQDSKILS